MISSISMNLSPKTPNNIFWKSSLQNKICEFWLLVFSNVKVWFQRPGKKCSNRFYRGISIFNRKVTFFVNKNSWFVYSPISGSEIYVLFFFTWENSANFLIWRPGGASDPKKDFRNGKFRQFAIRAAYHFSFWDALSEKLWRLEI